MSLTKENSKTPAVYTTDLVAVACGAIGSGVVSSIMMCPVSVVKIQQQVVSDVNMFAAAKMLYRNAGRSFKVFYVGYTPVYICEFFGRSAYFVTYEYGKMMISAMNTHAWMLPSSMLITNTGYHGSATTNGSDVYHLSPTIVRMLAAPIAGMVSWTLIYPLDVVKAKLQVDISGAKYNNNNYD